MQVTEGFPTPVGPSFSEGTWNFSLCAPHASAVSLLIFEAREVAPIASIPLVKTGAYWHVGLGKTPKRFEYAFSVEGPSSGKHAYHKEAHLLDPYAPGTNAPHGWGDSPPPLRGIPHSTPFDWEDDRPLRVPKESLIIYEMHVRGFTNDPSSGVSHPGTFLGLIEKIPYLKALGITAVELMPIYAFNERSHQYFGEEEGLCNYWGYSTVSFFAPMNRFAVRDAALECKAAIKALHEAGISVLLDVVYNHTNEGDSKNYYESFRGIDNATYYILSENGEYHNYSGCGNTVNCNEIHVRRLIIDSLAHWVETYHVDGFRFDLASILTRGEDGTPLETPPLIDEICADARLAHTHLIAEAWDCGGLYQVGSFPRGERFAEWNGVFRDVVRSYLKGDTTRRLQFIDAFLGSPSLYKERGASASVNFITAHDGFTLYDLTAYNEKHNASNRENNRDGHDHNISWNSGIEGQTDDAAINTLRTRRIVSFAAVLLLAKGIPMLLMGDEYGHTRHGNNNAWCHDSTINYFLWDEYTQNEELVHVFEKLIALRKKHNVFHAHYTVHQATDEGVFTCTIGNTLYVAINTSSAPQEIAFPPHFVPQLGCADTLPILPPFGSLVAEKE